MDGIRFKARTRPEAMNLDVGDSGGQKSMPSVDSIPVSMTDEAGVDREDSEDKALLPPPPPQSSAIAQRRRSSRRKVQWKDRNGNKLTEVMEFQPSDSSDSDDDEGVDFCICAIM